MDSSKPWWASKTVWANVIAFVATISAAFGFDLGLDAETQGMVIAAVMAIVNVVLRLFFTTKPIADAGA